MVSLLFKYGEQASLLLWQQMLGPSVSPYGAGSPIKMEEVPQTIQCRWELCSICPSYSTPSCSGEARIPTTSKLEHVIPCSIRCWSLLEQCFILEYQCSTRDLTQVLNIPVLFGHPFCNVVLNPTHWQSDSRHCIKTLFKLQSPSQQHFQDEFPIPGATNVWLASNPDTSGINFEQRVHIKRVMDQAHL